jgi:DNA adenine methylase
MRYPGAKGKLSLRIMDVLSKFLRDYPKFYFCEPFFGSGAIGLKVLVEPNVHKVWFNDYDFGIYALWKSIRDEPDLLIHFVKTFKPSIVAFHEFKNYLLNLTEEDKHAVVLTGFRKLAIHQISYSGLGTMSGGPLGGEEQKSDYKIDCRWSPDQLIADIWEAHDLMKQKKVKITCRDFETVIRCKRNNIAYIDPPYYVKGPELYQYSFTPEDHERLAGLLRQTKHPWLLSYDNCEEIRDLYKFAAIREVPLNYTIKGSVTKTELLIAPNQYDELLEERRKLSIFE